MDAPDLTVRTAALKSQSGAALSDEEYRRLAQRMMLEEQHAPASVGTPGARAAAIVNLSGPTTPGGRGGVDVNSYAGSMYDNSLPVPTSLAQPAASGPILPPLAKAPQANDVMGQPGLPVNPPEDGVLGTNAGPAAAGNGTTGRSITTLLSGSRLDPDSRALQRQSTVAQLNEYLAAADDRKRKVAVDNTEREATRAAFDPSADLSPEERVGRYTQGGGTNIATVHEIMGFKGKAPPAPKPGANGVVVEEVPGLGRLVRDKDTGELVDSGKVIKDDDKKNAEKALTAQEIQQINALQQSKRDLDNLDGAFEAIKDKDWGGPVAGRLRDWSTLGTDPNITRINSLITGATPNLARGVFREVGVLTDMDIDRYKKLLPNPNDTATQRAIKLKDLRSRLHDSTDATLDTLQAAGRNIGGLREQILGAAEKKAAAAGGAKTFKDADGEYPIRDIPGRGRGVIKGGRFYPIVDDKK